MKELSEESKFEVSLKTLGGIAVLIFTLVGMWFSLNASIEEAKLILREEVDFYDKDRYFSPDIENATTLLKQAALNHLILPNMLASF